MHTIRLPGLLLTSALAITSAFAISAVAVAAVNSTARPTAAAEPTPTPTPTPCPNGESQPCGASGKEREGVESGRTDTKKDITTAKEDIATAKQKVEQCPPGSKQCMDNLIGGGTDQHQGMDEARQGLAGMHPAPSDNAAPVMAGACQEFAAGLPPALKTSPDSAQLTSLCEAMRS